MRGPTPLSFRRLFHPLLVALAVLHGWLASSVSDQIGVSADEIAHLTAGYAYWQTGDYRLQPENGLLPQRLEALPLWLSRDLRFPGPDNPGMEADWKKADVWSIGARFFYESGNDLASLLRRSRLMVAAMGGLAVLLIGLWGRSLGGPGPGLTVAAMAALSPTLLAHSGLATSDCAALLGFLAASAAWWRLCHRVTAGRIAAAGLSAGLLALSKHSAVLLGPIALLLLVVRLTRGAPLPVHFTSGFHRRVRGAARLFPLAGAGLSAALVAWLVIWAGFGFRYEARGQGFSGEAGFVKSWESVLLEQSGPRGIPMADGLNLDEQVELRPGVVQTFARFARDHRLLPEAWIYGLAFVDCHSRYRLAFFANDWKASGWRAFFPVAALLKSSPAELLLALLGFASLGAGCRADRPSDKRAAYRAAAPCVVIAIYGAVSISSSLNIGHRHILPLYGFLFVLSALGLARLVRQVGPRTAGASMILLVAGQAYASASVRPHYLTYFNSLGGGPENGHRFFVDSSLDWGQGLPALKHWLATQPKGEKLYLSYFGSDRPSRLGIEFTRLGDTFFRTGEKSSLSSAPWGPGTYIISATMWQRVYTLVRGPWRDSYEKAYQDQVRYWHASPAPARDGDTRETASPEKRYRLLEDYEHLRFGRLCRFLRQRQPDAIVANQFFVYRLDASSIDQAMNGPLPDAPR